MAVSDRRRGQFAEVRSFVGEVFGADLHAKRIDSLAGATLGVMQSASLAVAMIGQALAQARGLVTKPAIKQVDRMLSNICIDVWDSFARWVPHQIGGRRDILVAMDWTDFDHDDQATLALHLVTGHGRAAPLLWLRVWKDELKDRRNDFEDACLRRLAELVLAGCRVTLLADRGFCDQKLSLRADPQHAGTSAPAVDGEIRRGRVRSGTFSNRYWGVKMRGWLSGDPPALT